VLLLAGVRVWNARQVQETGAGPSSGGLGGALLGPEKSGGPLRSRLRMVGVLLVFLWLFGCWIVDASIFVAVLLKAFRPSFWGGLGVLFLLCLCVWRQAMKGVWWMPWHQEPKKDVAKLR
jgi:hypothetical protein